MNPFEIDVSLTVLTVSVHPGICVSPSVCTPHVFLLSSFIGVVCDGIDLCTSRRILMPFPEAEGCFRGFSGPAILAQPGPPALGVQPELWERHCGGAPGLPLHAPLAGQYGPAREERRASLIQLTQHRTRTATPHSSVNGRFFALFKNGCSYKHTTRQAEMDTETEGRARRERETATHLERDRWACGQGDRRMYG